MTDQPAVAVGDELWLLHFDANSTGWVPQCHGVVSEVDPDLGYNVRGDWYSARAWPSFSSREDAEQYASEHPPPASQTVSASLFSFRA